jgi:3'-phosphoadenosine 5'-phosphosulfate sulfotransferase (PAPS reductase)/FAD synthetase
LYGTAPVGLRVDIPELYLQMTELISFGAGVNSTAMIIMLVNRGWRGPIVFVDTGCEWPETYCFMDYFENEWLKPRGLEITHVGEEYRIESKKIDLVGYCRLHGMIPIPAARFCTRMYKTEPLNKWASEHNIDTQFIGIATEEAHRQKGRDCPLIDANIDRKGCVKIIQDEGLSVPRKSGCWICPFQRNSQWKELWTNHRDLFDIAQGLEDAASKRTGRFITFDPDGKVTLAMRRAGFESQTSMFDEQEMDSLLQYKPCVCGL